MTRHTPTECEVLVVGAGIAGLRAAVELADAGRVLVLAKRQVRDSATHNAQGESLPPSATKAKSASIFKTHWSQATDSAMWKPFGCWSKKVCRALMNSSNGAGVHGANRLASNSLLEGLVYGSRAGQAMRDDLHQGSPSLNPKHAAPSKSPVDSGLEELIGQFGT